MKVLTLSAAAKVDIDFLWLHGASALFFMTLRGFAASLPVFVKREEKICEEKMCAKKC